MANEEEKGREDCVGGILAVEGVVVKVAADNPDDEAAGAGVCGSVVAAVIYISWGMLAMGAQHDRSEVTNGRSTDREDMAAAVA